MKRFLTLLFLFLSSFVYSQGVSGAKPLLMDKLGYQHISTDTLDKVAFSGDYNNLKNKPTITSTSITNGNGILVTGTGTLASPYVISIVQPIFAFPTRVINTPFTPSTTKAALVFYSISCSVTNPLLAGSSSATVTLQYSTNGGSTYQDVAQIGNLSSVALAVTVQLTNGQTGEIFGMVPANTLTQIKSVTTGTASVSVLKSTEIVY